MKSSVRNITPSRTLFKKRKKVIQCRPLGHKIRGLSVASGIYIVPLLLNTNFWGDKIHRGRLGLLSLYTGRSQTQKTKFKRGQLVM